MQLISLNLLKYKSNLKLKTVDDKPYVFDPVRKKYIQLLPEEFVRQLCISYLLNEKSYTLSLIKVEKMIKFENYIRRYDILTMNNDNTPYLLVECKAPNVKLDQKVLDQIAHYNLVLRVPYLYITNGKENYCFSLNQRKDKYIVLESIPVFENKSTNG